VKKTKKLKVSIGIPAYNEEANIVNLLNNLLNQKTTNVEIKEIIVINDGSTDGTLEKIINFINSNKNTGKKIKIISYDNRQGKWFAINHFLKAAKSGILVMESADTMPKKDAIENMVSPFRNRKVGIIGAHIVPLNKKNCFFGSMAHFIYDLHHRISLEMPKFGELIAFRNVVKRIPKTIVDEEEIASLIRAKNYEAVYEPQAIVYNKAPTNFGDMIEQRRRVFCGHLDLMRRKHETIPTVNVINIVKKAAGIFPEYWMVFFPAAICELIGRVLGFFDYIFYKEKHLKWKMIESVKKVGLKYP